MSSPDLSPAAGFTRVRLREGYAIPEVDSFVARALTALSSPAPLMRPADVRAVQFTPVRLREGYDMAEVDGFLDDLEQRLALRHPDVPEVVVAPPSRSLLDALRSGSVRDWVSRLRWALLAVVLLVWLFTQAPTLHLR